MTKSELLAAVSERAGVDAQTAEKVVAALFDAVTGVVKSKDKVLWPGFGAFSGTMRPARQGRNPATGATIDIPEALVCKFSQAAALKSTLNS